MGESTLETQQYPRYGEVAVFLKLANHQNVNDADDYQKEIRKEGDCLFGDILHSNNRHYQVYTTHVQRVIMEIANSSNGLLESSKLYNLVGQCYSDMRHVVGLYRTSESTPDTVRRIQERIPKLLDEQNAKKTQTKWQGFKKDIRLFIERLPNMQIYFRDLLAGATPIFCIVLVCLHKQTLDTIWSSADVVNTATWAFFCTSGGWLLDHVKPRLGNQFSGYCSILGGILLICGIVSLIIMALCMADPTKKAQWTDFLLTTAFFSAVCVINAILTLLYMSAE